MLRRALLVLALALGAASCGASPSTDARTAIAGERVAPRPPPNFVRVDDGLYRGGHPDDAALAYLADLGVRTIVDLEIDDGIEATGAEIRDELAAADARGLRVVRAPMSAFEPALSARFDRVVEGGLAVMRDPAARPVYVHCKHGQDRTGLMVGLYRVLHQGWPPATAYEEMKARGFHPMFLGLRHYFHEKTGLRE